MVRSDEHGPLISERAMNRATLARQMLLRREKATPVAVVERLAGMQAQLARPPFIGIWSRIRPFEAADLVKAIERRDIVRGTLMRGTLHLVSRKDYFVFRAVMQPALTAGMQAILRERADSLDIDCAGRGRPRVLRRRTTDFCRAARASDGAVPEGRTSVPWATPSGCICRSCRRRRPARRGRTRRRATLPSPSRGWARR